MAEGLDSVYAILLTDLVASTALSVRLGEARATALLTSSPVSKTIGNFFMGLNKPLSPTRLFTNSDKAIQWLHTFSDD